VARILRRDKRAHSIVFPIVVWVGAAVCVAGVAAVFGYRPWESSTWFRWDSGLYLDIARNGYELARCDDPTKWCGDSGWFPAYPWAIGALHLLDFPLQGTAAVISCLFAGATIVLLWATFFERRVDRAAAGALVYAAFAPGQIYHYAIFPLSLLALCSVAFMWLLYRGRVVAAGIAGAVATLTYPTGVVLAPVAALWLVLQRQLPLGERLRRIAITCACHPVSLWCAEAGGLLGVLVPPSWGRDWVAGSAIHPTRPRVFRCPDRGTPSVPGRSRTYPFPSVWVRP
jgi:hypothetical protein